MRQRLRHTTLVVAAMLGLCAITPLAHASSAPSGVRADGSSPVNVPYISRTRIDGEWVPIEDYSRNFTVTAPATVRPYREFTVRFDSAPILAVAAFNKQLTDLRVAYRVAGRGAVVKYRLEGGSNPVGATFRVEHNGADLVVRSDAHFPGGVEFDVPDLVVTVRAAGPGGTVTTSPGGSSFDDPAFYWFREQTTSGSWDPFENYVDPAAPVTFTTTTIQ
ncbi:hypothetical protein ABZ897_21550 [Nonomuraea sp. NPDC046802]|uniref:hypothetical protein n=1 Tax=Nonomuraea sp. NPDC046802 TaxID=3154919 RepID=UPI0033F36501